MRVLSDLGERAIIREILPRYATGIGDDCAIVDLNGSSIVVTTDPVPPPAAALIGGDPDLYWMGRLLVTINASDLAAAGATPVGFLAAIESPSDLALDAFERLLLGIKDACQYEGLAYLGGNLRESHSLSAVGTAIGASKKYAVRRSGAAEGDVLISIGPGGAFWRDAFKVMQGQNVGDKWLSPLFCPHSQLKPMNALAQRGLIRAAIDNSDGLLPSLDLLARANSLTIELDLDRLEPPAECENLGMDPARLWLGWGDWNVLAAVSSEDVDAVKDVAKAHYSRAIDIGGFDSFESGVFLKRGNVVRRAPPLESERFAKNSWFLDGVAGYIDQLGRVELP